MFNIRFGGKLTEKQPSAKAVTSSGKKVVFASIAIIVVVAALAAGLSLTMIAPAENKAESSESNGSQSSTSWIAKGDYAVYQGDTSVLGFNVGFTAKLEIVDLNATNVEIQTDFNMSTPYGSDYNNTTQWVSRENMTFQPEGLALNSTGTAQITVPGLGTRSCTVYQYSSQGVNVTYYVDDKIQWPIRIVMNSPEVEGQSYSVDITLVSTNIPGL
jgi:archaellin